MATLLNGSGGLALIRDRDRHSPFRPRTSALQENVDHRPAPDLWNQPTLRYPSHPEIHPAHPKLSSHLSHSRLPDLPPTPIPWTLLSEISDGTFLLLFPNFLQIKLNTCHMALVWYKITCFVIDRKRKISTSIVLGSNNDK